MSALERVKSGIDGLRDDAVALYDYYEERLPFEVPDLRALVRVADVPDAIVQFVQREVDGFTPQKDDSAEIRKAFTDASAWLASVAALRAATGEG